MRLVLGLVSLLIVVAVVAQLAKTQVRALPAGSVADPAAPATAAAPAELPQRLKADLEKQMQAAPERGEPKP